MATGLRIGDPESVGLAPGRVQRLIELGHSWVASASTPALVLFAAHRGVIVLHEAIGQLHPDEGAQPLTTNAIYPVASLAKTVVATAVMCLVEDGLLGLTRPVREYVPEFVGEGKDAVQVHHLLTHTSGLRADELNRHAEERRGSLVSTPSPPYQHPAVHEYLNLRNDCPLWKAPGTEASYCGYGFNLLGEIVGRVSSRPLAEFAASRIFDPLGMDDTSFALPEARRHRLVGRPADASTRFLVTPERLETPWPEGGLFSTARDLGAFCQMFLDRGAGPQGRVLSPAAVAMMTRNQVVSSEIKVGQAPR